MPRPRWPHLLREVSRHGTVRWVVRIGHGVRTPLTVAYGSPEFEAQYHAAITGSPPPEPPKPGTGSLQWLWDRYRNSSAWTIKLKPATRRQRENIMRGVLKTAAAMPIANLNRKLIIRGREDRKDTPAQANNFVKLMRGLCKWAADDEHMTTNPARDIEMLPVKTQGFPVWSEGDVESFRGRWPLGTRERLALELLIAFGHRRGDIASVGRQHLVNGGTAVKIRTEKNNRSVVRSLTPEAVEAVKSCPAKGLAFIAKADGTRLTKESFGNWFGEACRAAGVNKNAHGLRKYAATALTYAGATEAELDGAMGWTPGSKMSRVYTAERDDEIMAANAEQKLEARKAKEAHAVKPETSYSQPSPKVGNDIINKSNIK